MELKRKYSMSAFNDLNTAKNNLNSYFSNNFVELEDPENRGAGRKIFISKAENAAYKKIINNRATDFNAYYIYKQIVSLKNMGYLNSLVSNISMSSRFLPIEGGEIHYSVWQSKIYISEIKIQLDYKTSSTGNTSAGVYHVSRESASSERWKSSLEEQSSINETNLAINGKSNGITDAANYMPDFIKFGFQKSSLKNSYSLFYYPTQGCVKNGWRTFKDSSGIGGGTQAAKKLASVLALSNDKNLNITVHGSGNSLFKQALKIVASENKSLDKMTVFYANSTETLTHVDHWRKKTKMNLAETPPLVSKLNIRQNLTSGNFIAQPIVSRAIKSSDSLGTKIKKTAGIGIDIAKNVGGIVALGSVGAGVSGVVGWAIPVVSIMVSQGGKQNKEVMASETDHLVEGAAHYANKAKKLVWDPVHKMMVKA